MFSEVEQKAIKEKLDQLEKVENGSLTPAELANLITQRRILWFKENKDFFSKYKGLPVEEKAHQIIYFDHMRIIPEHSKIIRISGRKIRIESHNFCPYLEACKKLGLDTRFVCKKIGEPSVQKMCQLINQNLKFSRNYKNIRPHCNYCEEYIEII